MEAIIQTEQRTWAAQDAAKAADRPMAPVEDCVRWLEKDAVLLTHLVDQLDVRLAAVMAEGVPRAGEDPDPPPPGSSPLVAALALLHHRFGSELGRLERLLNRVEVG